MSFFEFRDGVWLWTATKEQHTVLYRSNYDFAIKICRQAIKKGLIDETPKYEFGGFVACHRIRNQGRRRRQASSSHARMNATPPKGVTAPSARVPVTARWG